MTGRVWYTERLELLPAAGPLANALRGLAETPRVAETLFPDDDAWRGWPSFGEGVCQALGHAVVELGARLRSTLVPVGGFRLRGDRLSYFVDPALWGQGYGAEMVHAAWRLIQPFRAGAPTEAVVLRENLASRRLLEGAGFRFAGASTMANRMRREVRTFLRYVDGPIQSLNDPVNS